MADRSNNQTDLSSRLRARPLGVAAVVFLLFFGPMWIASQGGVWPEGAAAFAVVLQIAIRMWMVLLLIGGFAVGVGGVVQRWLVPRSQHAWSVKAMLGLGVWLMLSWLLAWAGWMGPYVAWMMTSAGAALLLWRLGDPQVRDRLHPEHWPHPPWTLMLGLPAAALMVTAATIPVGGMWRVEALGYDVMLYHLQLPKEWLQAGAMTGLEHNVYSYLPNLSESGYMTAFALSGNMLDAIYLAQMLHVGVAIVAAACIGRVVAQATDAEAGGFAAACFVATPWVIITGSLAYNEMFVIGFGAAALSLVMRSGEGARGRAIALGFMLGCAVLTKLNAAFMIAIPVLAVMTWRAWAKQEEAKAAPADTTTSDTSHQSDRLPQGMVRRFMPLGIAALAMVLTIAPYLVRNATWTGNPVFPFATEVFGSAHWSERHVERWNSAHHVERGMSDRIMLLGRQWIFNAGYNAIGGFEHVGREAARFDREWGFPLLGLLALLASIFGWRNRQTRSLVTACVIILVIQIVGWLMLTHLQSRFMTPTLLPLVALVGIGFHALLGLSLVEARAGKLIAVLVAMVFTTSCFLVYLQQTLRFYTNTGQLVQAPPYLLIDNREITTHPLDAHLGPRDRVYIVADVQRLLYLQNAAAYRSAWDPSPLAELIRQHDGDPRRVTMALLDRNFTHVWIGGDELERLRNSYGVDEALSNENLHALARYWQRWYVPTKIASPRSLLYRLPPRDAIDNVKPREQD